MPERFALLACLARNARMYTTSAIHLFSLQSKGKVSVSWARRFMRMPFINELDCYFDLDLVSIGISMVQ